MREPTRQFHIATTTTLNGTATGGSGKLYIHVAASGTVNQQLTNVGVGTYYLHVKTMSACVRIQIQL